MGLAIGTIGAIAAQQRRDDYYNNGYYNNGYYNNGYGYGPGYYGGGPTYAPGYYDDQYSDDGAVAAVPAGGDDAAYCMQTYKSYDPQSGTYLGYDGQRHPCP